MRPLLLASLAWLVACKPGPVPEVFPDDDGDGYTSDVDCDDANADLSPAVVEICDEIDNDCDGLVDERLTNVWWSDADADGWGDPDTRQESCAAAPSGAVLRDGDCDDEVATVNPEGTDLCNGVDDDCDGEFDEEAPDRDEFYADTDKDGFGDPDAKVLACEQPEGYTSDYTDCDDTRELVHPGGTETCDGLDENCDGKIDEGHPQVPWYADEDGDEWGDITSVVDACAQPPGYVSNELDCDDVNASVNPGALEICNGMDDNCDGDESGALDPLAWYRDDDADGFGDPDEIALACDAPDGFVGNHGDCDDVDVAVNPDATDVCNGIDDNCADGELDAVDQAEWYWDNDGDGFGDDAIVESACDAPTGYVETGEDCDDYNVTVHPEAIDVCNGRDDDCSGTENDAIDADMWYLDADKDGHGDAGYPMSACNAPSGYVPSSDDCDDDVAAVYPGAVERCDGVDNNCAVGETDAIDKKTWYADGDTDGYGDLTDTTLACTVPLGYVADKTDCNDDAKLVHPGATDVCNGVDDDCSGDETDATDAKSWYVDVDEDGHGDEDAAAVIDCAAPSGYVASNDDCDDTKNAVTPGKPDTCDGVDNNCSGDEADATGQPTWYVDADGDQYGKSGSPGVSACFVPQGYAAAASDCNDGDEGINPGVTETCNGVDNNCSGNEDDAKVIATWYLDVDGDGYGTNTTTKQQCSQPQYYAGETGDCIDSDPSIHPGATDVCDGIDSNCSGSEADATDAVVYYQDKDLDGYGDPNVSQSSCGKPVGYDDDKLDCNDNANTVAPNQAETCNGVDNNCSGNENDATDTKTWYVDVDLDGYGQPAVTTKACTQPTGYDDVSTDCNDASKAVNPGATETCDGVDNNCSGNENDATNASLWYEDKDLDTYGNPNVSTKACSAPAGFEADNLDCNDNLVGVNPGAAETCDGVDNNCSGNENDASNAKTWYVDGDGDTYGATNGASTKACSQPGGYADDKLDCNDAATTVNPGVTETCNGVDNNCSGNETDATDTKTWYQDNDKDGYGSAVSTKVCTQPSGYDPDTGDCNDANANVKPGATEVCDRIDNNCDNTVDYTAKALWFDAGTDHARTTVGNGGFYFLTGDNGTGLTTFTYEAWVYRNGVSGGMVFNKWRSSREDRYLHVGATGVVTGQTYSYYYSGGWTSGYLGANSGTVGTPLNEWSHIAYVYDGAQARLYIDGVMVGSNNSAAWYPRTGVSELYIGGIYRDNQQYAPMYGAIGDVRISTGAIYTGTSTTSQNFDPAGSLAALGSTIFLWKLDEGTGTTSDDRGVNDWDVTISGASWNDVICRVP